VQGSSKCQSSSCPAHGRVVIVPRGVADAVAAFVAYQPDEHVPDPGRHQAYSEAYRRYRDLYYALKPVFERQAG
jgi:sugar (pentulose or hexulose) kinase